MVDFNALVGKELTPDLKQQINESGLDVRIIQAGYCYTCDWRPERFNIDVSEDNIITGTRMG